VTDAVGVVLVGDDAAAAEALAGRIRRRGDTAKGAPQGD
jgi:hypothetical protein